MGGGNAQKSAMARKKAAEKLAKAAMARKKAAEKLAKAGAGSQLASNAKAMNRVCQICRQSFMCTLAPAKLKEHSDNKHPKNSFEQCFPDVTL